VRVEKSATPESFKVEASAGGGFDIVIGNSRYPVSSAFTYPDSGWNILSATTGESRPDAAGRPVEPTWKPAIGIKRRHGDVIIVRAEGRHYRLDRTITTLFDHIDVEDTLTNLTDSDLGVIYRHEATLPAKPQTVVLSGNEQSIGYGESIFPENPTAFAGNSTSAIGFLRRNDATRIQGKCFVTRPDAAGAQYIGISNDRLCLTSGASVKLRWAVYPLGSNDYWQFVNSARRTLNVNFTIPGGFAFFYTESRFWNRTDEELADFVRARGARFIASGIGELPRTDGPFIYAHGTAIAIATRWASDTANLLSRWKSASPDVQSLIYFHCYCSTEPGGPEKYADSRMIDSNGAHAYYDYTDKTRYYPLYYPTLNNSYGKALGNYFDIVFNDIGATGIYWDEMSHTNVDYVSPTEWDGVTADIDPTTFRVIRRMSLISLLSQPWRYATVTRLQSEGRPLVANTMPLTETMASLHIPRFVETAPLSMIHKSQLYTPVGVGDSVINERTEEDVVLQIRRHIDHAALYYYYNGRIPITHPNLTSCMFPFTPIEIRPGVMIGKERILVSKPGVYGWADGRSPAKTIVFDDKGREVDAVKYIEPTEIPGAVALRLPHGFTAALLSEPL